MEDMANYCDNVVVMNDASVVKMGTVEEVFSDSELLIGIGLDVPISSRIAARLVSSGVDLQGCLYTVDGLTKAIYDVLEEGKK
jgi:energy-coupling factor transport system ATP-binding protein